ncbi:tungsten cofactor oxidoreductase radical SAM maturase [Thermococcus sp. MV5]|uniref:tungsten cofactor oxidoreductase radical SAM maturase n=1 Tax=Thermococcus sp. MV5 TaxID=1638272 RepID=UPI00143A2DE1|nr:tungsten cofactor oxidoreductase radical SAM maturase [Thermococcus sp. MV5]NJE25384.1 tungsten cofactor oxidoreductase radical SAM maturase [Thermococcus sp. MV5]
MEHKFRLWDAEVTIKPKLDMKYLYIEITSRCNLKCKMCFKQYWEDEEGDMDWDLFLKILDDAEEFPNLEMVLLGGIGEPTVHPQFIKMVREVKRRGFALGISTNGTLLTDEILEELVKLGVELIYFSMDTVPNVSGAITLGHLAAALTAEKIRKLVELKKKYGTGKPSIGVEVVVTKENYNQLSKIARYLRDIGADTLLLSNLIPMAEEQINDIVYDGSVNMEYYVQEVEKIAHYGLYVKIPYFELKSERRCEFDENNAAVIRWDGEVAPCYRFLHTYYEYIFGRKKKVNAYSFGNVKEERLSDIWRSRRYTWFRFIMKNYAYPSCTDCSLQESCDFVTTSDVDCWGNEPSCADCLWGRRLIFCPIPQHMYGKFF